MIKNNFHPHFLSDALQNISELIRNNSSSSPSVILKLSDLLSYILYESEEELIELDRELLMVKDYLDIEKTFYGNRIVINMKEEGDTKGIRITPLILLSLVQNCCEQFLISLQQKLHIDVETISAHETLVFRLSCNGYYDQINGLPSQNTGLNKALRRIQMTYADRHKLQTHAEYGFFSMTLILEPYAKRSNIPEKEKEKLYYEQA